MAGDKELLLGMGFDEARVDWAIRETKGAGLQPALDFLVAHTDDPVPDPAAPSSTAASGSTNTGGDAMDVEEDEETQALKEMYGKGAAGEAVSSGEQIEAKVFERAFSISPCY